MPHAFGKGCCREREQGVLRGLQHCPLAVPACAGRGCSARAGRHAGLPSCRVAEDMPHGECCGCSGTDCSVFFIVLAANKAVRTIVVWLHACCGVMQQCFDGQARPRHSTQYEIRIRV